VLASVVAVATDRFLNRRIAEARVTSDSPDVPVAFHVSGRASSPVPGAVVIFSNAAFVGRPYVGMRYYNRARIPAPRFWIITPELAKCWRFTPSMVFSGSFTSKFVSSGQPVFPG